mmetsp:Transcript_37645/g.79168  ORF Transcript_37645/g.79168 Transcript_37645/m.79168 type:complete len:228 (-) Transcript_37645:343-1026(-)|eukprot:3461104-Pleurochrysis_carterae.AAC.1
MPLASSVRDLHKPPLFAFKSACTCMSRSTCAFRHSSTCALRATLSPRHAAPHTGQTHSSLLGGAHASVASLAPASPCTGGAARQASARTSALGPARMPPRVPVRASACESFGTSAHAFAPCSAPLTTEARASSMLCGSKGMGHEQADAGARAASNWLPAPEAVSTEGNTFTSAGREPSLGARGEEELPSLAALGSMEEQSSLLLSLQRRSLLYAGAAAWAPLSIRNP